MRDRRLWWLGVYIYSNLNYETLTIAYLSTMKYGQALYRLIREVVIVNPSLGPVHILKAYDSDSSYHIGLRPTYTSNLGLFFPSEGEDEELVEIPITLPMGWETFPTIFFTSADTAADLANAYLRCNTPALMHRLDDVAEAIVTEEPPTLQPALAGLTRDPYLMGSNENLSAYVGVFVQKFLGLD